MKLHHLFNVFVVGLFVSLIVGCGPKPAPAPVPGILHGVSQSGITISSYLSFEITFTVPLTQDRVLRVKATSQPWLSNRITFSDELQQQNKNWVFFYCDNIADRIIDSALVAEITPYCSSIHDQATAFWKQHDYTPDEFVDTEGTHWIKKSKESAK